MDNDMNSLMTQEKYVANLKELQKYYVDLNYLDLTPDSINGRTCLVLQNYSKVTEYMIGAAINLNVAKKVVKAAKLAKDTAYNTNMFHEDVFSQKSKELREAKCALLTKADEQILAKASQDELDALAYYDSVKFVYENLQTALNSLKEQVKLFQNMLYMDPASHR